MLGPFKKNAVIGLNLYCGGAGMGAGGGAGGPPSGGRLLASGKGPTVESTPPQRDGGEVETGTTAAGLIGGGIRANPPDPVSPGARGVARPAPIGAEAPDVTTDPIPSLFAPGRRSSAPAEVADGAVDVPMCPEEELDGYEPEPPGKRPSRLAVLEIAREGGDSPNGSLPSTPPPAEEEEEEDELYGQSLELISRYLREQAVGTKDAKPLRSGKALETLRRVGDGVQRNHERAFQGMLRKLDIKNEEDIKAVSRVVNHVFSDGITNWGRIVTLISFGAFVAKHLKSINQESCIDPLAESITDVLVKSKRDWLIKQKGWEGFVEFFHVQDLEGGIRNVLLAFAGVAGVGAGLAYLIR
ncbi:induced myeloid leukemia cell differentiation protein Mcl-1 isoform X1 [Gracilinanus agilis]|uniref:induced myeloid leukemia cell differentiation protein Mcl-1 isoform X1 n=1 Tax=Gracilinanus agilis TaxID=191870 RepID=UPI001CFE2BF2|nr:induced myeloid leukemia cell differentiation protein Mcl-1 isoform X1 [Gracilinanus agilis]XP_044528577.1 induced myeloid leukemia cell differentiation protein Mcl-1 isoform X1 [Gracilinanus agilis]